jgi:hypothetical protein
MTRNALLIAGLAAVSWSPLVGLFIWLRPDMASSVLLVQMGVFGFVFLGVWALLYRVEQERLEAARFADAMGRLAVDSQELHGDVPGFRVGLVRAPAHARGELAA